METRVGVVEYLTRPISNLGFRLSDGCEINFCSFRNGKCENVGGPSGRRESLSLARWGGFVVGLLLLTAASAFGSTLDEKILESLRNGQDVNLQSNLTQPFTKVCLASDIPSGLSGYDYCKASGTFLALINDRTKTCTVIALRGIEQRVLSGSIEQDCRDISSTKSIITINRYGQSHIIFDDGKQGN